MLLYNFYLQDVEEELAKLSSELNDKKRQLERELLEKVDLQNNLQSLKEELSFRESVYEKVFVIIFHMLGFLYIHINSSYYVFNTNCI